MSQEAINIKEYKQEIESIIRYHAWLGTDECSHDSHGKCCQYIVKQIAKKVGYDNYIKKESQTTKEDKGDVK